MTSSQQESLPEVALPDFVVCPTCQASIDQGVDGLVCRDCEQTFPVVNEGDGRLPLLVVDPLTWTTGERVFLQQYAEQHRTAATGYLENAAPGSIREVTLLGIAHGLQCNAEFLDRLAEMLPQLADGPMSTYQTAPGIDLFAALRRDWSGASEAEEELSIGRTAITEALKGVDPNGRILVLGAGTGRWMSDFAKTFAEVVGIDMSFVMAAAWLKLRAEGKLTAWHLLTGNFHAAASECEPFVARRDLSSSTSRYIVADATRTPFRDGTFDAVVSAYFTDIVPLSSLLPEVSRLMRPGGRFIHYGPLGYAFPDYSEHYAIDQLPAAFAANGFRIDRQDIVTSTLFGTADRFSRLLIDNIVLVASRV